MPDWPRLRDYLKFPSVFLEMIKTKSWILWLILYDFRDFRITLMLAILSCSYNLSTKHQNSRWLWEACLNSHLHFLAWRWKSFGLNSDFGNGQPSSSSSTVVIIRSTKWRHLVCKFRYVFLSFFRADFKVKQFKKSKWP